VLFKVPQVASYHHHIHIVSLHLISIPHCCYKKREKKEEEKEVKKSEKIERGLCCRVLMKISVTLIW
jgi:hypothetical protein